MPTLLPISAYVNAIRNPSQCFPDDCELAQAVVVKKNGKPQLSTGGTAVVIFMQIASKKLVAVKFFKSEIKDIALRYLLIKGYIHKFRIPYFMHFEYRDAKSRGAVIKGIRTSYMKMEYIEGKNLKVYIEDLIHQGKASELKVTARKFAEMIWVFQMNKIAHGDLHADNIKIDSKGELRLIDLDTVYVLSMDPYKMISPAIGHSGYQHPRRLQNHFDAKVDNFSALVIYLTLIALASDPGLYNASAVKEEEILFTGADYQYPDHSPIFQKLRNSRDPEVVRLAHLLAKATKVPFDQIPQFSDVVGFSTRLAGNQQSLEHTKINSFYHKEKALNWDKFATIVLNIKLISLLAVIFALVVGDFLSSYYGVYTLLPLYMNEYLKHLLSAVITTFSFLANGLGTVIRSIFEKGYSVKYDGKQIQIVSSSIIKAVHYLVMGLTASDWLFSFFGLCAVFAPPNTPQNIQEYLKWYILQCKNPFYFLIIPTFTVMASGSPYMLDNFLKNYSKLDLK